jgi:hypothetical protein
MSVNQVTAVIAGRNCPNLVQPLGPTGPSGTQILLVNEDSAYQLVEVQLVRPFWITSRRPCQLLVSLESISKTNTTFSDLLCAATGTVCAS